MTRTIPLHALQICDIWNREKRVSLLKKKREKKRFELYYDRPLNGIINSITQLLMKFFVF